MFTEWHWWGIPSDSGCCSSSSCLGLGHQDEIQVVWNELKKRRKDKHRLVVLFDMKHGKEEKKKKGKNIKELIYFHITHI